MVHHRGLARGRVNTSHGLEGVNQLRDACIVHGHRGANPVFGSLVPGAARKSKWSNSMAVRFTAPRWPCAKRAAKL